MNYDCIAKVILEKLRHKKADVTVKLLEVERRVEEIESIIGSAAEDLDEVIELCEFLDKYTPLATGRNHFDELGFREIRGWSFWSLDT